MIWWPDVILAAAMIMTVAAIFVVVRLVWATLAGT